MSYRVRVTRTAARQLAETLHESMAAACVEFLYGPLADNPHRANRDPRRYLRRGRLPAGRRALRAGHPLPSNQVRWPKRTRHRSLPSRR